MVGVVQTPLIAMVNPGSEPIIPRAVSPTHKTKPCPPMLISTPTATITTGILLQQDVVLIVPALIILPQAISAQLVGMCLLVIYPLQIPVNLAY